MEGDGTDIRSHQLQLLMRFLLEGTDSLPSEFQSISLPNRRANSQKEVADQIGVSQPTVSGWKTRKKKISPKDEFRLAQYCQVPLDRLKDYLNGHLLFPQLWQDSPIETSPYKQVLDLLPHLQLQERVDVMYRCLNQWAQEAELLPGSTSEDHPLSLSWLILKELLKPKREWSQSLVPLLVMAQASGLPIEQFVLALLGQVSSPAVLRGFSQVLTKDLSGDLYWQLEELEEIARAVDDVEVPNWNISIESLQEDVVWHNWVDLDPLTIAKLVDLELQNRPGQGLIELSEETQIEPERLLQLRQGAYPTTPELCDLAQGLRKQPGVYWSEDELRRLRISQFGNGDSHPSSNGEPNGSNGEGQPIKR